jgi:ABC-type multidrug transport system fused ATPase/permease subunit
MTDVLAKLNDVLDPQARRQAYSVFALVLVMAVVEVLGVASLMPFVALLATPTILETNAYLAAVFRFLGFGSRDDFLIFVGSVTLVLLVGSVALRAVTLWIQLKFVNMQTHAVASRLVGLYLRQPYEWFLNNRSSDLGATVLGEVTHVLQGVAYPVMLLFANSVVALLLTGLLVAVEPFLAAIVMVVLGGAYLGAFLLGKKYLERIGDVRVQSNRERHKAIYEAFGGIKDIKVAGMEANFQERFSVPSQRMARSGLSSAFVSEMPSFVMQALVFGGMMLVMIYLIVSHGGLQEALPIISLYAFAGYRLMPTLQLAYRNLATIRYTKSVLDTLHRDFTELGRAPALPAVTHKGNMDVTPIGLRRSLELRNLSFRYAGSEQPVLKDLCLTVPAFSTIALVGSTGSGKTTAVDVILGLLKPTSGQLLVDDLLITEETIRTWRRSIGYVPQSIFLADDSVAANIALGIAPDRIDRQAVERAARIANLHDFITKELPEGYETLVGERGVRLSGGQRQRIGIARALYHDPELLIFDEATSALDGITELAVMDAVYNLGRHKTIIMIAHRLSTVRGCDRIHLLENGSIVAAGTYDELLATSEVFRAMVKPGGAGGDHVLGRSRSTENADAAEGAY